MQTNNHESDQAMNEERERKNRRRNNQNKEVFQCGNKNKFCVLHFDLVHTLFSFFFKTMKHTKKRARGERIRVVWRCLYRLSFGVASNESTESAESDCSQ